MIDMTQTIIPKSDQLNADDLIGGPKTIKITAVKVTGGDQAVSIFYENDVGKPWKPCKTSCRVLILAWGANGENYIGKRATLFLDPKVKWAGKEVGGIRISHLSDIESDLRLMLTATRGKKEPCLIKKLDLGVEMSEKDFEEWGMKLNVCEEVADVEKIGAELKASNYDAESNKKIAVIYKETLLRVKK